MVRRYSGADVLVWLILWCHPPPTLWASSFWITELIAPLCRLSWSQGLRARESQLQRYQPCFGWCNIIDPILCPKVKIIQQRMSHGRKTDAFYRGFLFKLIFGNNIGILLHTTIFLLFLCLLLTLQGHLFPQAIGSHVLEQKSEDSRF